MGILAGGNKLRITNYELRITNYELRITNLSGDHKRKDHPLLSPHKSVIRNS